jgi:hypothetical protein
MLNCIEFVAVFITLVDVVITTTIPEIGVDSSLHAIAFVVVLRLIRTLQLMTSFDALVESEAAILSEVRRIWRLTSWLYQRTTSGVCGALSGKSRGTPAKVGRE